MRNFAGMRGNGRRLTMLAAAGLLAAVLAGCSMFDDSDTPDATGTPFTQALNKDYGDLASQASSLPAEPAADSGFFDSLNPFADSPPSASDLLSKAFTAKAEMAAAGTEPEPEAAADQVAAGIRARLVRAVAAGKDQFPEQAARAQADYDCWVLYGTVPSAAAAAQACKTSLDTSLLRLETAARPAPPPMATPAPAPVAAPAPAPVSSDFNIFFDFDSWTLKAEQLKVLDDVIATARTGGQANINIVGHTDTSGAADYNQRLSVKRANVVVEALVQMVRAATPCTPRASAKATWPSRRTTTSRKPRTAAPSSRWSRNEREMFKAPCPKGRGAFSFAPLARVCALSAGCPPTPTAPKRLGWVP